MEQELTFGRWVREKRIKHGLTLPALVERTGLDLGTISRIENEHTQATLSTAIRICDGLREHLENLVQALQGRRVEDIEPYDDPQSTPNWGRNVLLPFDVEQFLNFFHKNPHRGRKILADLIADIYERLTGHEGAREESIPLLDSDDIDKLLIDSPLYSFEIKYPREINAKTIQEIYKQGGELIPADIDVYFDKALSRIGKMHKESLSGILSRLRVASVERVKLADVLSLDKELSERLSREGEILGIYARVVRFNHQFFETKSGKLALMLVTISRWLQHLNWDNITWIDDLREELEKWAEEGIVLE